MMLMVVLMVVIMIVVMVLVFRGTTAYGTHGFSQPPFLSPATLHRI
jgi:preprotein translocase subunit SecG